MSTAGPSAGPAPASATTTAPLRVAPLRSVADLTPEWWAAALVVPGAADRIEGCRATQIGTGQVADTFRVEPTYQPGRTGPRSLVVKVPSSSPGSRAIAKVTRGYEIESGFYRDLAAGLAVTTPGCHYAGHDPATGAYTVVLEDLGGARAGDQLSGCTPDEAAVAVEALARLHGSRWGHPALGALPWLRRHDGPDAEQMAHLVATVAPRFLRRYGDRLPADIVGLVERFPSLVTSHLRQPAGPRTVVHGDFRADNLLFGPHGVTVIDWQTAAHEAGTSDLAYFLGGSLTAGARHGAEADLVALYRQVLRSAGVLVSEPECWAGYRRYALGGLLTVVVASMLVRRTERGDEMFVLLANNHGRHALDLNTEHILRSSAGNTLIS